MSVVNCAIGKDCEVFLTMNDDYESIELFPGLIYHQNITKYGIRAFTYNLHDPLINSVSFILDSITGDATFTLQHGVAAGKVIKSQSFLGNKKVITFEKDVTQTSITGTYDLLVKGNDYSFYQLSVITNGLHSKKLANGLIHPLSITEKESIKSFQFFNGAIALNKPFVITITPMNCYLQIKVGSKVLSSSSSQQIVISPGEAEYTEQIEASVQFFSFTASISNENDKCVYYLSAIEGEAKALLALNEGVAHKAILVPNQISQKSFFFPWTFGLYNEHLIVDIKSDDFNAPLEVSVRIAGSKTSTTYPFKLSKDKRLLFPPEQTQKDCEVNCLCKVTIEIKVTDPFLLSIPIYIKVKAFHKLPSYFNLDVLNELTVHNVPQYYYTDIGLNEEGEVLLDTFLGKASYYARIVRKDLNEKMADWNNQLILPNKDTDPSLLLEFDPINSKFSYRPKQTSGCRDGCHLYISVFPEDYSVDKTLKITEYGLTPLYKRKDTVYQLKINEYAKGFLPPSRQVAAYSFVVPIDTEEIRFNLISRLTKAFISHTESSLKWEINDPTGLLIVTPKDLHGQALKGQFFFITISSTDNTQSVGFRFQATGFKQDQVMLNYISSERSETCVFTPSRLGCNLIRYVRKGEDVKNIQISLESIDNRHNSFVMYAKTIPEETFEASFTKEDLPEKGNNEATSEGQYNTNLLSFAFTKTGAYYIIISVQAAQEGKALALSTSVDASNVKAPIADLKHTYIMKKGDQFAFSLGGREKFLLSLTPLSGQGVVKLSTGRLIALDQPFLTEIAKGQAETDFSIEALSNELTYNLEYSLNNINSPVLLREVPFGKETKIISDVVELKSSYYFRAIPNKDSKDMIEVNVKFPKYKIKTKQGTEDFVFNCYLTDSAFINKKKQDPTLKPDDSQQIQGLYDAVTRSGQARVKLPKPKTANAESEYFVLIELTPTASNVNVYEELSTHITTHSLYDVNSIYDLPKLKYHHYTIEEGSEVNIIKLTKAEPSDNKMVIEFSSCSGDEIDFAIRKYNTITRSDDMIIRTNDTSIGLTTEARFGAVFISVRLEGVDSIGFVAFKRNSTLQGSFRYVIKYKTGLDIIHYQYSIEENLKVDGSKNKSLIQTTFAPVQLNSKTINATYFHRIQSIGSNLQLTVSSLCLLLQKDLLDSQRKEPETLSNEMSMSALNLSLNYATYYHVSVVASLLTETEEEILLGYTSKQLRTENKPEEDDKEKEKGVGTGLIIAIVCSVVGGVAIFVIVGFLIYRFCRKRSGGNTNTLIHQEAVFDDI